jgi:cytochrome P450
VPDATVSGTLLGLVVAWMPSASKMLALAIDELLDRPDPLAWADDAARRGDEDELAAILFEAVRFRPPAPGIFRTATRPVRVGIDSRRPKTLRAGCAVLAATMSAMMDPDALEAPDEFRLDRPWTDYLHFGYGLHTCAGEALNRASLPAVLAGLLRHGALARAPGPAGHLRWRYPYPSRLEVTVRARRAP